MGWTQCSKDDITVHDCSMWFYVLLLLAFAFALMAFKSWHGRHSLSGGAKHIIYYDMYLPVLALHYTLYGLQVWCTKYVLHNANITLSFYQPPGLQVDGWCSHGQPHQCRGGFGLQGQGAGGGLCPPGAEWHQQPGAQEDPHGQGPFID